MIAAFVERVDDGEVVGGLDEDYWLSFVKVIEC